jgi:hypothetical protein
VTKLDIIIGYFLLGQFQQLGDAVKQQRKMTTISRMIFRCSLRVGGKKMDA